MPIIRNGSQPSTKGPAENFTGAVRMDPIFRTPDPGRLASVCVTFEPGARTAWHTHPMGQTLIVTFGTGWHQCEGEEKQEIRAGDIIFCPPGHKHWHGATSTTAMTHISMLEHVNGKMVEWMEKVSDEQYLGAVAKS